MNVLLTGANGFLGQSLALKIESLSDFNLTSVVRSQAGSVPGKRAEVCQIDGDTDGPSGTFLRVYMDNVVTPILGDLEEVNLKNYKHSLMQRFGNKYMKDQIDRICSQSSAKIPKFILPTLQKQLALNGPVKGVSLILAAWAIYSIGNDEKGSPINIKDVMSDRLMEKAKEAKSCPEVFLEIEEVFGDLKDSKRFVKNFKKAYAKITAFGIERSVIDLNSKVLNEI